MAGKNFGEYGIRRLNNQSQPNQKGKHPMGGFKLMNYAGPGGEARAAIAVGEQGIDLEKSGVVPRCLP